MNSIFDEEGLFKGYPKEELKRVKKIVEEKGLDWLITAMIHGSIGYHSYLSAKHMIHNVLKGKYAGCERTSACFKGNPIKEILSDARCFEDIERRDPQRVKRILEFVKATSNLDWIQQTTLGLAYPTMGI
jgi:hypothetical protein